MGQSVTWGVPGAAWWRGAFADDMFMPRGLVTVANAGHVVPILRKARGAALQLGRASGPPLGIWRQSVYVEQIFTLDAGDVLVLVTDGVVDGPAPIVARVRNAPLRRSPVGIESSVARISGGGIDERRTSVGISATRH